MVLITHDSINTIRATANIRRTRRCQYTYLPEHAFAHKRFFATMAKAKYHKLNNFLMFLLEGKSVNPANTEKSDKNGNIALVDLKYF